MEKSSRELNIPEFKNKFSDRKHVSKAYLRNHYRQINPDLTDQSFRRILYGLEKQNYIVSSGSGIYLLQDPSSSQHPPKNKFVPALSSNILKINHEMMKAFPYLGYLLWETKILHEFMVHHPGQNLMILETEKGTEDSVFNHLSKILSWTNLPGSESHKHREICFSTVRGHSHFWTCYTNPKREDDKQRPIRKNRKNTGGYSR